MKKIIAFCGLAGSGKDTACDYLVDRDFKKMSFAAPLKQMAKIAFGFTDEQLYGSSSMREEQDHRYPFSGICPKCDSMCLDFDTLDFSHDRPDNFATQLNRHYCETCKEVYPRFVNARLALRTLGTEWGRRLYKNIWAKAAINQIEESDHDFWCISDLRFKNELHEVKRAGGYVVRLLRGATTSNHASETELLSIPEEQFDFVIANHGTVADLYQSLDNIILTVHTL